MNKNKLFSAFVVCAALALSAAPAQAAQRAASGMGGSFGVMAADLGNLPGLGASYWLTDKVAMDAALGVVTGSPYAGGTDASGRPVNDAVSEFAFAFTGRYTLAQPVSPLHVQALARLSVGNRNSTTQVLGVGRSGNTFGVAALLGVGVEVFLLGSNNLSVQADTGLSIQSTSNTSNAPGAVGINDLSISLGQAGRWLPMNVAVHYYF